MSDPAASKSGEPSDRGIRIAGLMVPLLGNGLSVGIWLPLLAVPPGSIVRPMVESLRFLLIAVVTAAVGSALAYRLISSGRRWGWITGLFSWTPFAVGNAMIFYFTSSRQLVWSD